MEFLQELIIEEATSNTGDNVLYGTITPDLEIGVQTPFLM